MQEYSNISNHFTVNESFSDDNKQFLKSSWSVNSIETPLLTPSTSESSIEFDTNEVNEGLEEYLQHPQRLERLPSANAEAKSFRPMLYKSDIPVFTSDKELKVLVVGVGYVGMHLVNEFGKSNTVVGVDINEKRALMLAKEYYEKEKISFTTNQNLHKLKQKFDLYLIAVPTLLQEDQKTIDTQHIKAAIKDVEMIAQPGSTVVIESSVSVGMTRELLGPKGANLRSKGVFVGFSPERVDPGRSFPAFQDIPKIVSGIDEASKEMISQLYSRVFTTVKAVASLETAEFTKLYENCQRMVLISYVNEIADACKHHGVNILDVCSASATKPFGFTPFSPSLGAGGHCIPVNPYYLMTNCNLPTLQAAASFNQQRPKKKAEEVANLAKTIATARSRNKQPSILIIGMGFKKGEASITNSAAAIMADKLQQLGCSISYLDDFVESTKWLKVSRSILADLTDLEERFDIIIINHSLSQRERLLFSNIKHTRVLEAALL